MPRHIKLIARIGNGFTALLYGLFALIVAWRQPGAAISLLLFSALAIFNLYVIETCIRAFSEEESLQTEIRKAELRHKLADLEGNADDAPGKARPGGNHNPAGIATPPP